MTLTVIFRDTNRTRLAVIHENDWVPFQKRTVQIELTPEQEEALKPRHVGVHCGQDVFEERGECWIEPPPGGEGV